MSFDPLKTIASQYANSPTLVTLVDAFAQQVLPTANFANFLSYIWNLDTAQGFGLDILGRIVGLNRQVTDVPDIYGMPPVTDGLYTMTDDQYRRALTVQVLHNISNGSAKDINAQMRIMSNGRGNAFVQKVGTMSIKFKFYYAPMPYEYALVQTGKFLMAPTGVEFNNSFTINNWFGFAEAESWQPFDQGVFADY